MQITVAEGKTSVAEYSTPFSVGLYLRTGSRNTACRKTCGHHWAKNSNCRGDLVYSAVAESGVTEDESLQ